MAEKAGLYSQNKDPVTGLTQRQSAVLKMLVDEGKSQLQVANELKVSRQYVRQIVEALWRHGYQIPNSKPPSGWTPKVIENRVVDGNEGPQPSVTAA